MPKSILLASVLVTVATTAAHAQNRWAAPAVSADLMAEHQQWEGEHQRWAAEHATLARRLRAAVDSIERGGDGLARHGGEINGHWAALTRGGDAAQVAIAHARLRTEHDEARIVPHELVDAVRDLEQVAREDEASRGAETGQTGATPRP